MELTLVLLVVVIALAFEYINGFHDTANSIATVVATKVMTPGQAVMLAASTNLIGALAGTAVAQTIATGLIDSNVVTVTPVVLICALVGAIGAHRLRGTAARRGRPGQKFHRGNHPAHGQFESAPGHFRVIQPHLQGRVLRRRGL